MLGQIRKRTQQRRQQSFESKQSSTASPCGSPLTTPTMESPTFWTNHGGCFDTQEQPDTCEIYKTPTQKAVPIEENFAESNIAPFKHEEKVNGGGNRSKRYNTRKLKLQLSKTGNRYDKHQLVQQRENRYFLRSKSAEIKEIDCSVHDKLEFTQ